MALDGTDATVAPVLPYLTDSVDHLDALLGQIAAAGATGWHRVRPAPAQVHPPLVHGVAGPFAPELVDTYRRLYRHGATCRPTTGRRCDDGRRSWWTSTASAATGGPSSPRSSRHRRGTRAATDVF